MMKCRHPPSHHILLSYTCNFMLWWAATTFMLLWKFKILKPLHTNKSGLEGTEAYAMCTMHTNRMLCVLLQQGSVETSLTMVCGIGISLGVCWYLLLRMHPRAPPEALSEERDHCNAERRDLCLGQEFAVWHWSTMGCRRLRSHAALPSYLHMLAPALGFSTVPCIFLNNFVKFEQQYKWLIFPQTVLVTCFTKAHPVTYVFKAAAKLKCIVLWLLTRLANINFYEVYSGHNIPSTVNNFEDIGPMFNFSVKVSKCFWFWFEKLPYLLLQPGPKCSWRNTPDFTVWFCCFWISQVRKKITNSWGEKCLQSLRG